MGKVIYYNMVGGQLGQPKINHFYYDGIKAGWKNGVGSVDHCQHVDSVIKTRKSMHYKCQYVINIFMRYWGFDT